jgi:hypothetical protein
VKTVKSVGVQVVRQSAGTSYAGNDYSLLRRELEIAGEAFERC